MNPPKSPAPPANPLKKTAAGPFWSVIAIHAVLVAALPALIAAVRWPAVDGADFSGLKLPGFFMTMLGIWLYVMSHRHLSDTGKGTPAVWAPPVFLVREGPYRSMRNPMYTSLVMMTVGEAMFGGRGPLLIYAGVLFLGFHLFVTLYEEPALIKTFGPSYDTYRRSVPRWFPRARKIIGKADGSK